MEASVIRRPTLRHRLQDPTASAVRDFAGPSDPAPFCDQLENHSWRHQHDGGGEARLRNTQRKRLSQLQFVGKESSFFEEISTQQAEYVFEEDVWDRAAFGLQRWLDGRKQKPGTRHHQPEVRRLLQERSLEEKVHDVGRRGLLALDRVQRSAVTRSLPDRLPKISRSAVSSPELHAAPPSRHRHLLQAGSPVTPAAVLRGPQETSPWPTSLRYAGCGARAQAAGAPAPLAARWHSPTPGAIGPRWR